MARPRIILGYTSATSTQVVYAGLSGAEAEQALKADRTSQRFEIFEGPGRRKNNPFYDAAAKPAPAAIPAELPTDLKALNKAELQRALADAVATIDALRAAAEPAIDTPPEAAADDLPLE